jgi:hypothetical protein
MREIEFRQWAEVLARTNLPERQKASWTITLKWYLGFCRRSRAGVTVQSARDFIEWAQREKQPEPWQVEGWKEALNWFFRAANAAAAGPKPGSSAAKGRQETSNSDKSRAGIPHRTSNIEHPTSNIQCEGNGGTGLREAPAWKSAFLTVVRRRHYSYRTEG